MAVTEFASGTKTATGVGTQDVLNTTSPETTDGVFMVVVDPATITGTEVITVRVKEKTISGGTQRVMFEASFTGTSHGDRLIVSPPYALVHGWDITIEASASNAIPWSIRKA